MGNKKIVLNFSLAAAIVSFSLLSCQMKPSDGQLSCAADPCPGDMFCDPASLRCYASEEHVPYYDPDGSVDTEIDNDAGATDSGTDDQCPDDPDKLVPGECGCGIRDKDTDKDGVADCHDSCLMDPDKTEPEVCGCGYAETTCSSVCAEASEGEDMTLDCGPDWKIERIEFASYGTPLGSCDGPQPDHGECYSEQSLSNIEKNCLEKSSCTVKVDRKTLGDPECPDDVSKRLIVEYFCRAVDSCPDDPEKLVPGVCGCGKPDLDSDGDGTLDCQDECPSDPNKIEVGHCGCGGVEIDSDGDGTYDCNDGCVNDPTKTDPGACGCGKLDIDSDGDGAMDCEDQCPTDSAKTTPGFCGCGRIDADSDGDGTMDCEDKCPLDSNKIQAGICGCGTPEVDTDDSDGDGTIDCLEECPDDQNKTTAGQCGCGNPDIDEDKDGAAGCIDDCPRDPAKTSLGICGCGIPDTDDDGDGVATCIDSCPFDPGKTLPGICGCGVADTDSDGDGTPNCHDSCPNDSDKIVPGVCGCGTTEVLTDTDNDGTADCIDECPNDPAKTAPGTCGCGVSENACDILCVEALDHENAVFDCGAGGVIESILFASFGDPTGSCDGPDEPGVGVCDAKGALSDIEDACLGQTSCTVEADKSVLGDPHCPKGVKKKLIAVYYCRY